MTEAVKKLGTRRGILDVKEKKKREEDENLKESILKLSSNKDFIEKKSKSVSQRNISEVESILKIAEESQKLSSQLILNLTKDRQSVKLYDQLWKSFTHCPIRFLQKISSIAGLNQKMLENLKEKFISFSLRNFYQLCLQYFDLIKTESNQLNQQILFNIVVSIGDLLRYSLQINCNLISDLNRAIIWYKFATMSSFVRVKAFHQLAIVSLQSQDYLDFLFYFIRAICYSKNEEFVSSTREHFEYVLHSVKKKWSDWKAKVSWDEKLSKFQSSLEEKPLKCGSWIFKFPQVTITSFIDPEGKVTLLESKKKEKTLSQSPEFPFKLFFHQNEGLARKIWILQFLNIVALHLTRTDVDKLPKLQKQWTEFSLAHFKRIPITTYTSRTLLKITALVLYIFNHQLNFKSRNSLSTVQIANDGLFSAFSLIMDFFCITLIPLLMLDKSISADSLLESNNSSSIFPAVATFLTWLHSLWLLESKSFFSDNSTAKHSWLLHYLQRKDSHLVWRKLLSFWKYILRLLASSVSKEEVKDSSGLKIENVMLHGFLNLFSPMIPPSPQEMSQILHSLCNNEHESVTFHGPLELRVLIYLYEIQDVFNNLTNIPYFPLKHKPGFDSECEDSLIADFSDITQLFTQDININDDSSEDSSSSQLLEENLSLNSTIVSEKLTDNISEPNLLNYVSIDASEELPIDPVLEALRQKKIQLINEREEQLRAAKFVKEILEKPWYNNGVLTSFHPSTLTETDSISIYQPYYLVIDTNCFIHRLEMVKILTNHKIFRLAIPLIVLRELEGISKDDKESSEKRLKAIKLSSDALNFVKSLVNSPSGDTHYMLFHSGEIIKLGSQIYHQSTTKSAKINNDDLILESASNLSQKTAKLNSSNQIDSAANRKTNSIRDKPHDVYKVVLISDDGVLGLKASMVKTTSIPCVSMQQFFQLANLTCHI